MKKIRAATWWLMSILVFTIMFALIADIYLYLSDKDSTISAVMQDWFGASTGSYRAAMVGFLAGSLLNHFTAWGRDP